MKWKFLSVGGEKAGSSELHALGLLKSKLEPWLHGQRCLVVGSAPRFQFSPHDRSICVNASGWSAKRLGIEKPDLTVMSAFTLKGKNSVQKASIEAVAGLRTRLLLLIDHKLPLDVAENLLGQVGYGYDELLTVSPSGRGEIIKQVCGEPVAADDRDARPSTGMFAAALTIWTGAASTVLTGFSFAGGHSYMDGDTPRHHVAGDQWFLSRVQQYPVTMV